MLLLSTPSLMTTSYLKCLSFYGSPLSTFPCNQNGAQTFHRTVQKCQRFHTLRLCGKYFTFTVLQVDNSKYILSGHAESL